MREWLITGIGHDGDRPNLELRALDESGLKDIRPLPETLAFTLSGARRCIGYRAPGASSLESCPDEVLTSRASQCDACREKAVIIPCLHCTGLRCGNPERRPTCVQPANHALYLASFGLGRIKVGVSHWERRHLRVLERGAQAGLIIARDDGQQIRRLESTIHAFGIPDKVTVGEVLDGVGLGEPVELLDQLHQVTARLRLRLVSEQWLDPFEEVDLPLRPVFPRRPNVLRAHPGEALDGPVFGIYGQTVVFERDGGLRAIDLSSLVGYPIVDEVAGARTQFQMAMPF